VRPPAARRPRPPVDLRMLPATDPTDAERASPLRTHTLPMSSTRQAPQDAERCRRRARRNCQSAALDAGGLPTRWLGQSAAEDPIGLRCLGVEFFWPLLDGATLVLARPMGTRIRPTWPDHQGSQDHHAALRPFHVGGLPAGACRGGLPELATRDLQRRGVVTGAAGAVLRQIGRAAAQSLRPTEAAVDVTYWACRPEAGSMSVPIVDRFGTRVFTFLTVVSSLFPRVLRGSST